MGFGIRDLGFGTGFCLVILNGHDPATLQAPVGPQYGLFGLQHVEGLRPELQPQDVAFPGQKVVVDVHSRHRLEMAADDPVGDECGGLRVVVAAVLDVVKGAARTASRSLSSPHQSVTRA